VYCRDFGLEVEARNLASILGHARFVGVLSADLRATIESGLAAWRVRHDFAALEATQPSRSALGMSNGVAAFISKALSLFAG